MSEHFSFYIKKDGKYIPFKLFTKTYKDGSTCYYYLSDLYVRRSFLNRWSVLNRCGKKFIANEGSLEEVEATPNDVIAFSSTIDWKIVGIMCLSMFALSFIMWIVDLFIHFFNYTFLGWMEASFGVSIFLGVCAIFGYLRSLEYKSSAKEWNELKIPEEQLIIVPIKSIEQIAEEYAESQVSSGKDIPEFSNEEKNIISRHFMAGYNQSKSRKDNQTNL